MFFKSKNNGRVLTVALIGAGLRGMGYTNIMKENPGKFKVVAVAEPDEGRRNKTKKIHGIADDMCFESWTDILSKDKLLVLFGFSIEDYMRL